MAQQNRRSLSGTCQLATSGLRPEASLLEPAEEIDQLVSVDRYIDPPCTSAQIVPHARASTSPTL